MKTHGESCGSGLATPQVSYTFAAEGAVQLVGFRPTIVRLARYCKVHGHTENTPSGATIVIEGTRERVERFMRLFPAWLPRLAVITNDIVWQPGTPTGASEFVIRASTETGPKTAALIPDASICPICSANIRNPSSRFYGHAFASCIECGPRVSMQTGIPGDRAHTTMAEFPLCARCEAEYTDIISRYYHAQAFCCPDCGPELALWDTTGSTLAIKHDALGAAIAALRAGTIVAIKGIGGFHLMCDATNAEAVRLLRERKKRTKPLAMMADLSYIHQVCKVSRLEKKLLTSPSAPIVLLAKKQSTSGREPAPEVVGDHNPCYGFMVPYTPLHQLLVDGVGVPLVATSANFTDEPVITDEHEACERLRDIADLFLVHNRRIVQHMDDSVVRVVMGKSLYLRRARGYAPFPLTVPHLEESILAVGAHQKNTVALGLPNGETGKAVVSQHIGDLTSLMSEDTFGDVIEFLSTIYEVDPSIVVCDAHDRYYSTQWAQASRKQVVPVQHHVAHVLAVAGECDTPVPYLGAAFDGTGLGTDRTIWGGECLAVTDDTIERIAHLKQFRLPGGDKVAREPYRSALGVLHALYGDTWVDTCSDLQSLLVTGTHATLFACMLSTGEQAPITSSAGRLFDAVASILGIRQQCGFEGQAAMELEWQATRAHRTGVRTGPRIELTRQHNAPSVLSWEPLIERLIAGVRKKESVEHLAYTFHYALASAIVLVAQDTGHDRVVLSGGCFQNKLLLELTVRLLKKHHIKPYWPTILPPNDGAISFGQIQSFIHDNKRRTSSCA